MTDKHGRTVDRESGEVTEGTVRPFADVLRDLGKGQVADEAAVLLTDLVQAVVTYGKKGVFTLKITVAPFKNGDSSQVTVAAIATSRPPSADPIQAVFYAGDDGNLLADDPRMEPMFSQVARPDARLGRPG